MLFDDVWSQLQSCASYSVLQRWCSVTTGTHKGLIRLPCIGTSERVPRFENELSCDYFRHHPDKLGTSIQGCVGPSIWEHRT